MQKRVLRLGEKFDIKIILAKEVFLIRSLSVLVSQFWTNLSMLIGPDFSHIRFFCHEKTMLIEIIRTKLTKHEISYAFFSNLVDFQSNLNYSSKMNKT